MLNAADVSSAFEVLRHFRHLLRHLIIASLANAMFVSCVSLSFRLVHIVPKYVILDSEVTYLEKVSLFNIVVTWPEYFKFFCLERMVMLTFLSEEYFFSPCFTCPARWAVFYGCRGRLLGANLFFLLATIAWAAVLTYLAVRCIKAWVGLRVPLNVETLGMDT